MQRSTVAAVLVLAVAGGGAARAAAPDGYPHGRILSVEAGVTLQRADEDASEEAFRNLPFLPGDRLWTDAEGRAELQFPQGAVVRLDRRSKLDYAGHEEERGELIVLRLWSGSVFVHAHPAAGARFGIVTPAGMVQVEGRAVLRVDVASGQARVSVFAGEAALDDGRQHVRVGEEEQTLARWGETMGEPRKFDVAEADAFAVWDGQREAAEAVSEETAEYLPEELAPYEEELEKNGIWQNMGVSGWIWIPNVQAGWRPYWSGQWAWTAYGWTWVPNEGWGWAPFHYGSWDYSASLGWYWAPGTSWAPARVSWAVADGYVGWCPLGRNDRPVVPWGDGRGHAVPRLGGVDAWSLVRRGDLGGHDLARRLVSLDGVDPAAFQVGDREMRPTRDASRLGTAAPLSPAVSTRQTIGDFVRELQVDNQTTIPAPWTRGYGPPPAGVAGARYGPQPRENPDDEGKEKESRSGIGEVLEKAATPRSMPRSVPTTAAPQTSGREPGQGGTSASGHSTGRTVSSSSPSPAVGSRPTPAGHGASPAPPGGGASGSSRSGHAVSRRDRK